MSDLRPAFAATAIARACKTCLETKPITLFPRYKKGGEARRPSCQACRCIEQRRWNERNVEKRKQAKREWDLANPEKRKIHAARTYRIHAKKRNAHTREWLAKHPGKNTQYQSKYYKANREAISARKKKWYLNNKSLNVSYNKVYRGKKFSATPVWANLFFMQEAYALAALRTKITGSVWEVDHIVPIKSKLVCGLHCETNLRVITFAENRTKGNYYWPDMPEVSA